MQFSAVQLLSQLNFPTPWTVAHQASLSITSSRSLLKLVSIESVMPSNHPLSSPSPAFNLSQHQGLFWWVGSSHQVAEGLELQLQHQSFQWIFRVDFLNWLVWFPCCPRDSQESSLAPQFDKQLEVHWKLDGNIDVVSHKHRFQKDTMARKQGPKWTFSCLKVWPHFLVFQDFIGYSRRRMMSVFGWSCFAAQSGLCTLCLMLPPSLCWTCS